MVGFPPPIDKRVTLPDSNFFSFPKLRWSVCHMRELLPSASIARNPYAYSPLKYALLQGIDELTFKPSNSNKRMTWQQILGELQWHFHNKNGAFAARGVHGQTIYIDSTAEMVIVRLESHPIAANGVIDPTSLPAYQAVADFLMKQSK
ncbi:hypothetical protein CWB72_02400 [Pseudoalteromonas phenolica]|nr:hypothetical protein CWB72_02400 [Pseudoalteromonas phenolica]